MRLLFLIVSGVLIGLVLHIVSLLAVPTLAPRDAYSRLAAFTVVNEAAALDVADAEKSLPFLDPAFAYMACRFDVSSGPLQIRVPLAGRYVAVSFHSRDGTAFFSLNDRSALGSILDIEMRDQGDEESKALPLGAGTIAVTSPTSTGFVLVRAFEHSQSTAETLRNELSKTVCRPRP